MTQNKLIQYLKQEGEFLGYAHRRHRYKQRPLDKTKKLKVEKIKEKETKKIIYENHI